MNRTSLRAAVFLVAAAIALPAFSSAAFAGETAPGCYSEHMKFGASGRIYTWQAGC